MSHFCSAVRLAAAAALLSLTGCVGQPWTLSRSPDSITLRWYSGNADEAQARSLAGAYCIETSRSAALGNIEQDGSAVIARYRCG